ncbi:hypothetical protein SCHPADRAFT_660542 [Schizopora paradoxa]|uniref:Uncharacterized protein n=1 Tax=Schizopora paradoxa TaxID=27342 RepID=A0A0H2RQV0_9AGAM|nr:hypothetical protein SCHPADRAFT_660542 [Schizopora paradoxa]
MKKRGREGDRDGNRKEGRTYGEFFYFDFEDELAQLTRTLLVAAFMSAAAAVDDGIDRELGSDPASSRRSQFSFLPISAIRHPSSAVLHCPYRPSRPFLTCSPPNSVAATARPVLTVGIDAARAGRGVVVAVVMVTWSWLSVEHVRCCVSTHARPRRLSALPSSSPFPPPYILPASFRRRHRETSTTAQPCPSSTPCPSPSQALTVRIESSRRAEPFLFALTHPLKLEGQKDATRRVY